MLESNTMICNGKINVMIESNTRGHHATNQGTLVIPAIKIKHTEW